jgi:DNA-binding phage protein
MKTLKKIKKQIIIKTLPSFTQFLQNFMENENVKNNNEFLEEKEELNQKMEKMKTIKKHSQMTVNHLYSNIG